MNKYCNASDFTSIFIPRVFANITRERIIHIVENVVPLGSVERIDIVEIDEKTNRVWVHFTHWYDTEFVNEFKKLLLDETKQAKIVYDAPWFWIVLKNTHRLVNGLPKIRIDLEDGEISNSTSTVGTSSSKSTVTFTTPLANHSKKIFGKYLWSDIESDSDEELSSLPSSSETRPNSPSYPPPPPLHPCPPTYPNPYYQQQMPPIYPTLFYNIPSQIPHFPQYQIDPQQYSYPQQFIPYHHIPIAPTLPTQFLPREMIRPEFDYIPHPVASWNGISFDEMYMDDIEDDDAFLSETDYQEMLLELDDDDIYSDEDLYNMYLIEKEELSLINQIDTITNDECDIILDYSNMFPTTGTGFDETTVVFHEHFDALLKSDESPLPLDTQTNTNHSHKSFDKFTRPIIVFKDKSNSTSLSATHPLKMVASSSYKDMLVKQN